MKICKNLKKMNELNTSLKLETNSLNEVISKMKDIHTKVKRKFDESVDIIVNININLKKEQGLRGTCVLPHGNGKKIYFQTHFTNFNEANEHINKKIIAPQRSKIFFKIMYLNV